MRVTLLLLLVVAAVLLGLWASGWCPPDRFNPWAPLDLRAEPDVFVSYKLHRLGEDTARCRAALTQGGARFTPVPDRAGRDGCGWHGAVQLSGTGVAQLTRATTVSCPLAASLVLLDRHVLQPVAEQLFGQPVRRIDHVGSYACRNVYGEQDAALSSHATAEAIDVTAFQLGDGHVISVGSDWQRGQPGVFLHRLEARGCRYFGIVLGPDYNAAHRTHFHMQDGHGFGGWCR